MYDIYVINDDTNDIPNKAKSSVKIVTVKKCNGLWINIYIIDFPDWK